LRVLLLTGIFSPCPQSASQRFSSFAQILSSRGFDVTVLACSRCLKRDEKTLSHEEISVYDFRCPRFLISASFVFINPVILFLYFLMGLVIVAMRGADIVYSSVPGGETAIVGSFLSKIFKIPLIIDVRDTYPPPTGEMLYMPTPSKLNEVFVRFFRMLYRNSDKIICVDASIQRRLIAYGVLPEKTAVIPNGVDTSIYKPCNSLNREAIHIKYGLPLNKFIFVYAGALAWYYPVTEAIKGLKKLSTKKKDIGLLIISHASYAYEKKMAKELQLENMVRFMGPLSVADTARILSACDVGLVVYRGEDYWKGMYGSKIFSYMSCELPILASGPPGSVIEKLLREYRVGFFVGPPDEGNFAKGLSYFVNNRKEVRIMGENARKVVERFYDRRKLGLKLVSLIDELCVGGAP
jgi:glycosyltransferase involved in cell wall biosynthesis